MSYVERRCSSPVVACTWERVAGDAGGHRVVPDACVDLIWSGERLLIAGPDTGPRLVAPTRGDRLVGARLRPGAAGTALALPAHELRDLYLDAGEILGAHAVARLLDLLAAGADPHAALRRALEARGAPGPLVGAAVAALARPRARVASVAAELGLSARHLQRLVSDAVGYGPKTLARVLRFRRLQALAQASLAELAPASLAGLAPASLAGLALDAGYCDQAHMTAEVTALAGIPPVRFLKDRVLASA